MELNEFIIEKLTEGSSENANAIRSLTKLLGSNYKELTDSDFEDMVNASSNHLFVVKEKTNNRIVGMVTVIVYRIPYAKKAYIEDIVVDQAFRNKGLGKQLLEHAIAFAQSQKVAYVQFTSKKTREAGNALYQKLGFKIHDTNVYRLNFSYEE